MSRFGPADLATRARLIEFGAAVRGYRAARGWSQDDLADAAGINRQTVSRIENAKHCTDLMTMWRVADALGVEAGALFRACTRAETPPDHTVSGA